MKDMKKGKGKDKIKDKIGTCSLSYTALALVLLLWELLPRFHFIPELYLPRLSSVLAETAGSVRHGNMLLDLLVTLYRCTAGVLLASAAGIALGFLGGYFFPKAYEHLSSLLRLLGQINPYSLLPLFVLFFGIGETTRVSTVAWTAFWPILFSSVTGAGGVEPELLKSARAMGSSHMVVFLKVALPSSFPSVFNGMRIGTKMAFFVLTAAEMNGANAGLGYSIHLAGETFDTLRLYSSGLCIVLLGIALNQGLLFFQRRVLFWKKVQDLKGEFQEVNGTRRLQKRNVVVALGLAAAILIAGAWGVRVSDRMVNDPSYPGYNRGPAE